MFFIGFHLKSPSGGSQAGSISQTSCPIYTVAPLELICCTCMCYYHYYYDYYYYYYYYYYYLLLITTTFTNITLYGCTPGVLEHLLARLLERLLELLQPMKSEPQFTKYIDKYRSNNILEAPIRTNYILETPIYNKIYTICLNV